MMKAIVAADKQWNIGFQGRLLVHLPGDMRYFKEKTKGNTIVMGRKTYESLPGQNPLPERKNIVITRDPKGFLQKYGEREGLFAVSSLPDNLPGDVFVIGGGEIYSLLLPYCDEILVTKINELFEADTKFPNLDKSPDWELEWKSQQQEENGVKYEFTRYRRNYIRS